MKELVNSPIVNKATSLNQILIHYYLVHAAPALKSAETSAWYLSLSVSISSAKANAKTPKSEAPDSKIVPFSYVNAKVDLPIARMNSNFFIFL